MLARTAAKRSISDTGSIPSGMSAGRVGIPIKLVARGIGTAVI